LDLLFNRFKDDINTTNKQKQIDDYAFGGGAGMVLMIEPIDACILDLKSKRIYDEIIYMSPDGELLNQKICNQLSLVKNIIILCGHYKGIDERVRENLITREISVGDYDIVPDPLPLIIADGGIGSNGDIAKAFVAGADFVMAGSMFARCIDSPAMIDPTDPTRKLYFGSASAMNGNRKNIEGKTISMPMNGMTYEQLMLEVRQDLTSAISYAGGNDLDAFEDVEYSQI
jgi:hypothetical protein